MVWQAASVFAVGMSVSRSKGRHTGLSALWEQDAASMPGRHGKCIQVVLCPLKELSSHQLTWNLTFGGLLEDNFPLQGTPCLVPLFGASHPVQLTLLWCILHGC